MTAPLVHHASREVFADPSRNALGRPRVMDGDNPIMADLVAATPGQLWSRTSNESEN